MLFGHEINCKCKMCERYWYTQGSLPINAKQNLKKALEIRVEELEVRLSKLELQFELTGVKHDADY